MERHAQGGRPPITRRSTQVRVNQPCRGQTLATAPTQQQARPSIDGLLTLLEEASYQATRRLELQWRLPRGTTQKLFPDRYRQDRARSEQVAAAMTIALDLDACRALLRGDPVPYSRLDHRYLHLLERWPT